jgi:hypothetical protein
MKIAADHEREWVVTGVWVELGLDASRDAGAQAVATI